MFGHRHAKLHKFQDVRRARSFLQPRASLQRKRCCLPAAEHRLKAWCAWTVTANPMPPPQIRHVKNFTKNNPDDVLPEYLAMHARRVRHKKWMELAYLKGYVAGKEHDLQLITEQYYSILVRKTVLRFLGKQRDVQGKSRDWILVCNNRKLSKGPLLV